MVIRPYGRHLTVTRPTTGKRTLVSHVDPGWQAKAGDLRHSDSMAVGILSTRVRTHELLRECAEEGVDVSDVIGAAADAPNFVKSEKTRFNEINRRLRAARGGR